MNDLLDALDAVRRRVHADGLHSCDTGSPPDHRAAPERHEHPGADS